LFYFFLQKLRFLLWFFFLLIHKNTLFPVNY